jgi:hypothetical protein
MSGERTEPQSREGERGGMWSVSALHPLIPTGILKLETVSLTLSIIYSRPELKLRSHNVAVSLHNWMVLSTFWFI